MEDFVTYEQAIKLKELGFDWKVNHYYNSGKELCENFEDCGDEDYTSYEDFNNYGFLGLDCSAPTLSQATKWLREVKGIIIVCVPEIDNHNEIIKYTGRWYCESNSTTETYPTYEAALLVGIDSTLKLIKE